MDRRAERERDRREPPPTRRRYGSPDWSRGSPPRRGADGGYGRGDWEREVPPGPGGPPFDDRTGVPSLVGFFMSQLPVSSSFDGEHTRLLC